MSAPVTEVASDAALIAAGEIELTCSDCIFTHNEGDDECDACYKLFCALARKIDRIIADAEERGRVAERERIGLAMRQAHGCTDGNCLVGTNPRGGMHTNGGCRCASEIATMPSAVEARRKLQAMFRDLQQLLRGKDVPSRGDAREAM